MRGEEPNKRLIVALDVDTPEQAEALVSRLGNAVSFYKINFMLLLVKGGLEFIAKLIQARKLFIDIKMGDIGATIEGYVRQICRLNDGMPGGGVSFVTLSPSADKETYKAASRGRNGSALPKILAIPLLSSLDQTDLSEFYGQAVTEEKLVKIADRKAGEALTDGCDGLIASGSLIEVFRERHPGAIIVSPGIRLAGSRSDDHKRFSTPGDAIRMGANYLVVGRPIREAPDPRAMAERIIDEIAEAAAGPPTSTSGSSEPRQFQNSELGYSISCKRG